MIGKHAATVIDDLHAVVFALESLMPTDLVEHEQIAAFTLTFATCNFESLGVISLGFGSKSDERLAGHPGGNELPQNIWVFGECERERIAGGFFF